MTKQAVLYARVSTVEQGDNYSLPTQLEGCRQYAAGRGYEVAAEFADQFTGTEMDRPRFSEMKEYVRLHKVQAVVVYDVDRFSRLLKFQAVLEKEIEDLGAVVEYVVGGYDGSAESNLTKHVKGAIAEYEIRQRSERSRRGRQGKLRAGYVMMSHLRTPYGYSYVSEPHKGKLVIEEGEAPVVRQIFEWLLGGMSCYAIAQRLTERGVPTRGDLRAGVIKGAEYGAWAPATVTKMVRNPVYKGQWTYGKTKTVKKGGKRRAERTDEAEQIVVETPAIVEPPVWEEAQLCLVRNKTTARRNAKHEFLLRGLIVCACGRRWLGVYKTHLNRGYYRCGTLESRGWLGPDCTVAGGVRQDRLEEAVWEKVTSLLLDETHLRAEMDGRRSVESAGLAERRRRLHAIRAAVADVQRKIDLLLDQLLEGTFSTAEINKRKERLLGQRREMEADAGRLEAEIAQAELTPEQEETVLAFARRVRAGVEGLNGAERRRVLDLLSVSIQVIDQENFCVTALFPLTDGEITLPRLERSRTSKAATDGATVQLLNTSSK